MAPTVGAEAGNNAEAVDDKMASEHAIAQTGPAWDKEGDQITNVCGVIARYPFPSWIDSETVNFDQSRYYQHQDGPDFILEQIPADQTFEAWSSLFALRAQKSDKTSFLQSVAGNIRMTNAACGKGGLEFHHIVEHTEQLTMLTACGSYTNGLGALG